VYTLQDGAAQMLMEFNVNALCPLVGQVLGFNAVFRPRYLTLYNTHYNILLEVYPVISSLR
jgi:hypothetical protein